LYCSKQRAEIGLQWYFGSNADTDGGVMMMVVVVVVVGVTG